MSNNSGLGVVGTIIIALVAGLVGAIGYSLIAGGDGGDGWQERMAALETEQTDLENWIRGPLAEYHDGLHEWMVDIDAVFRMQHPDVDPDSVPTPPDFD